MFVYYVLSLLPPEKKKSTNPQGQKGQARRQLWTEDQHIWEVKQMESRAVKHTET